MKILFLSIFDPYVSSGPGNHLRHLSNALVHIGCQVHILAPGQETKSVKIDGLIVHYIKPALFSGGFLFSLTTIGWVNRLVKKYNIDIVHGQSPSSFGYAFLSRSKTPFVVTVHGTSFGEMFSSKNTPLSNVTLTSLRDRLLVQPLTAFFTALEYRFADKVIVVSASTAKEVKEFFCINEKALVVIHNGINPPTQSFNNQPSHLILFVGRLTWRKGVKYLIDALPKVIKRYPDVKLLIVGSGEQQEVLELLAKKTNIANCVKFLGFISDDELRDLYGKIGVYVQPSLYEPLGIAIMEAMSNGKPVVASNVGGIPELISNNFDGILVEPGNSQELSNALIRVFSDSKLAESLGAQAQAKINKEFTWTKIAEKTLNLYENLTG